MHVPTGKLLIWVVPLATAHILPSDPERARYAVPVELLPSQLFPDSNLMAEGARLIQDHIEKSIISGSFSQTPLAQIVLESGYSGQCQAVPSPVLGIIAGGCSGITDPAAGFPECFERNYIGLPLTRKRKFWESIRDSLENETEHDSFSEFLCPAFARKMNLANDFCSIMSQLIVAARFSMKSADIHTIEESATWGNQKAWQPFDALSIEELPPIEYIPLGVSGGVQQKRDILEMMGRHQPEASEIPNNILTREKNMEKLSLLKLSVFFRKVSRSIAESLLSSWFNHPSHKWRIIAPLYLEMQTLIGSALINVCKQS